MKIFKYTMFSSYNYKNCMMHVFQRISQCPDFFNSLRLLFSAKNFLLGVFYFLSLKKSAFHNFPGCCNFFCPKFFQIFGSQISRFLNIENTADYQTHTFPHQTQSLVEVLAAPLQMFFQKSHLLQLFNHLSVFPRKCCPFHWVTESLSFLCPVSFVHIPEPYVPDCACTPVENGMFFLLEYLIRLAGNKIRL